MNLMEIRNVKYPSARLRSFLYASISIFLLQNGALGFSQPDIVPKRSNYICAKYFDRTDNLLSVKMPSLKTSLQHNQLVLNELNHLPVAAETSKKRWISYEEADALFKKIANHPVVGICAIRKYDRSNTKGFCYGRSEAFAHEARENLGVDEASIRKIFATGFFYKPGVTAIKGWGFHAVTLIRASNHSWYAFDPNLSDGPVMVEKWYEEMRLISLYRPFNLFVTDSHRVYATDVERRFLTLDMGVSQYFKDYFESLKEP